MIRPLMGLKGTNWVVALLVVVVVALILLFCAIVLSTEPTTA
jgi:type VI protein secretion system component VasF